MNNKSPNMTTRPIDVNNPNQSNSEVKVFTVRVNELNEELNDGKIDQNLVDSVFGKAREYKKIKTSTWLMASKISVSLLSTIQFLNVILYGLMFFYTMYNLISISNTYSHNPLIWRDWNFFGILSPLSIVSFAFTILNLIITVVFHFLCLKFDEDNEAIDEFTYIKATKTSYYNKWNVITFIFLFSFYIVFLAALYFGTYSYGYILAICMAVLVFIVFIAKIIFTIFTITYMFKKE